MSSVIVNTRQLDSFVKDLNGANQRIILTAIRWVTRLSKYTERRMKYYAKSRSPRSTGKLSNSVTYRVSSKGKGIHGIIYPAGKLPYRFAAEHGKRGGQLIRGKMSFPVSSWKKGSRNPSISRFSVNGRFNFTKIRVGKYKGRAYVEKSYNDLQTHYQSKESIIANQIGTTIIFNRKTG